jgi:NADH dehydrogenase FAD-containing subunit
MKTIVILGGSYAGITTAHQILNYAPKTASFKVIIVSPNTHLYWNMAAARGILPDQYSDDKLFKPILPAFAKYPSTKFEFILGSADNVDTEEKMVVVSSNAGTIKVSYDFLVLATGTRMNEPEPFKTLDTTEKTIAAVHDYRERIKNARRIVIAGAGVTGVEVAGELAATYGLGKEIILVSFISHI